MKIELLPCPFCGSDELSVEEQALGVQRLRCCQCGMTGPGGSLCLREMSDAWNKRSPVKTAEGPEKGPKDSEASDV